MNRCVLTFLAMSVPAGTQGYPTIADGRQHDVQAARSTAERKQVMPSATASTSIPTQEDLLSKNDAEFAAGFDRLYSQTWGEGSIPRKYKELCGASLSVVTRCEVCLIYHLKTAAKAGATGQEAIEAMRIGLLSGGSITIPTVRAGYKALHELGLIQ
jgi:AhpD family alkylhydroperoxidase